VDEHAQFVPLEINAVIAHPKTVQSPPALLQFAELVQFRAEHLLRQAAKLAENLQLQLLRHPRQFGGAGRCENDLKHSSDKV